MASTVERGYGAAHQALRRRYAASVNRGEEFCRRCGRWIAPGSKWHLGHNPFNRDEYWGPLHVDCNCNTTLEKSLRRPMVVRADPRSWL